MSSNAEVEREDWRGETAVIVATGPSAAQQPLGLAQGKARCIAIKSMWRLVPWADVLYGCDKGWWLANQGVRQFPGLRVSASPSVARVFPGVRLVKLAPQAGPQSDGRLGGNHSGLQAVNLAIRFGSRRIVLVGFDMTLEHGTRCFPDEQGVRRADVKRIEAWRIAMDAMAPQFLEMGVEVTNCSACSALIAFPKRSFSEVFGDGRDGAG